jgi:Na+-driven multidrug efflux pump/anti-sigma regulatory factor (Ser/Thr protein kinase)
MFERTGTLVQRKFREYLIPTVLMAAALYLSVIANSIIIGNLLGEIALSVVGLVSPLAFGFNAIFLLLVVGGVICASVAKGKLETDNANRIFSITIMVGVTIMLVISGIMLLIIGQISNMLAQGDEALAEMIREFFTPLVFIGPATVFVMGLAQFICSDGKPRMSAYIALFTNIINIILTYSFIRFFGMGLMGAALASVFGYISGIFIIIPYLRSKERTYRFIMPKIADLNYMKHILKAGSPRAVDKAWSFLRVLILNALIVGTLGPLGISTMAVCINTIMLAALFINGTGNALLPIVGTQYGEKDYRSIRYAIRSGFKFMFIGCLAVTALFIIIPGEIGRIFGVTSQEGIEALNLALRLFALSLPISGINTMLQNFYQTTGRIKTSILIVSLNSFVFIVLFAFIFAQVNPSFIWLAFFLSELMTFFVIIGIVIFTRKKESVEGFLLLPKELHDTSLDITIPATIEAAVTLSDQVIKFCRENGTDESSAMQMGIAVEEMAVNTAVYGHKKNKGMIDVLVRASGENLILRLRDDGIPFDSTKYQPEDKQEFAISGIDVVRRLAKDISYTRLLGFNVTIVTIERKVLKEDILPGS